MNIKPYTSEVNIKPYTSEEVALTARCMPVSSIQRMLTQLADLLNSREAAKAVIWQYRDITDEGVSPFWTNCDIGTYMVLSENHYRSMCDIRELFTHPPAESGEAKDAARYRWLESMNGAKDGRVEVFIDGEAYSPGFLSGQIDDAMSAESRE